MASIRFIHTSDLHLDTSFAGSGFPSRLGDRKREAIRGTFRRILDSALAEQVSFILIAGDLFEHDRATPDTIEFLKQQLERVDPIPVFIAPGNHDPHISTSPYAVEAWPSNVHIFREEEFRSVEILDIGVRVVGFGYVRTRITEHPFARLSPLPRDAFNVVLMHGSDESRVPAGKFQHAPFSVDELAGKNINYCALGHYHQQRQVPNQIDGTSIWYCGIPEGRGWDEEGICGYLQGEVENGQIRVRSVPSCQYPLRTLVLPCDTFSSREQIIDAILQQKGSAWDAATILRVRLEGSLDSRLGLSFAEIEERLAGELLHVSWENQTHPAIDYESLSQEKTLRGTFIRTLNGRIATATDEDRPLFELAREYGAQALLGRGVRLR